MESSAAVTTFAAIMTSLAHIRNIVRTSVEIFATAFRDRHIAEVNDTVIAEYVASAPIIKEALMQIKDVYLYE